MQSSGSHCHVNLPLDARIPRTVESSFYGSIDHHRKHYDKALQELFQAVTNVPER